MTRGLAKSGVKIVKNVLLKCMLLPQPQAAFSPIDFGQAALGIDQLFQSQAEHYNRDKVSLIELYQCQPVRVQGKLMGCGS